MNECKTVRANVATPQINAFTFPSGPRGVGIKEIIQEANHLKFVLDDDSRQEFLFPAWWFGTREEYNKLTAEERSSMELYFIEEGT